MNRRVIVTVVCLTVVLAGLSMQPATANDEWTGNCKDAKTITPGTYNGTLSPNDQDSFKIKVPEGDYITMNVSWDTQDINDGFILTDDFDRGLGAYGAPEESESDKESIDYRETGELSTLTFADANQSIVDGNPNHIALEADMKPAQFRVYSEGSGPICIGLATWEGAGWWKLSFSVNEEEPPVCNTTG